MHKKNLFSIVMCLAAIATLFTGGDLAQAGPGMGMDASGTPGVVQTYYANSPSGLRTHPVTGAPAAIDSGTALRKFVDGLPGLGPTGATTVGTAGKTLGQYIPVAVKDTTTYPGSEYYEIAIVEYMQYMHSDLPKATRLRGYVQVSTTNVPGSHIQLFYPNGTAIKDINGANVYAVDKPTYLGPVIVATRDVPVRIKYSNYLPKGSAGDLFIPVDETLDGAGMGPDGVNKYKQSRMAIHLHGGNTPWISDGTPHQWTVPVGESTTFMVGDSFRNVPDMPDPGQGSGTLFYTNAQAARLMFYHDHALGITRLNVYAGTAAGYLLTDPAGEAALTAALPAGIAQIPLVLQDKTFVPKDITSGGGATGGGAPAGLGQDEKWDLTHWGQYGDLWFPHVYELNQDPTSVDGTNPVGRWDWGPYFWPIFPSLYNLPTGAYGDVTTTPEAFMDTPVINGMAYPVLSVDPKAYRFRVLAAGNDRFWNLGLYLADTAGATTAATATASVLNGLVDNITVDTPGAGYTSSPGVYFDSRVSGGSGASAVARLAPTTVQSITVLNGGSGYTSAPAVTIDGGGYTTRATATATITGGSVTSITVNTPGVGYIRNAYAHIFGGGGEGAVGRVVLAPTTLAAIEVVNNGSGYTSAPAISVGSSTEVKMVPFNVGQANFPETGGSAGTGWGTPNGMLFAAGVPDPAVVGPNMILIGTEGGLIPEPKVIPPTPINFEYNKRSITIMNVLEHGLYLGPAERADVIIDFSQYRGKTLILYNDAPAPLPAGDPRIDYYTNGADNYQVGGAEPTQPGYGPNTRTIMQIVVNDVAAAAPYDPSGTAAPLAAALPAAYAVTQDVPIVAQAAYKSAFPAAPSTNTYAHIYTGSYREPSFAFPSISAGGGVAGVTVTNGGSGYTSAPTVVFTGGGGSGAAGVTVLNPFSGGVTVTQGGSGYTSLPTVTLTGGGGTYTSATATMGVNSITVGFNTYSTGTPAVTISAPPAGGVQATAVAVMTGIGATRRVGTVNITNRGSGYTSRPTVTIQTPAQVGGTGTAATGTLRMQVTGVTVTGAAGYTGVPIITFAGGGGIDAAALSAASVTSVTMKGAGTGYTSTPTVSFTGGGGTGATGTVSSVAAVVSLPVKTPAIQELFEPFYGRMNATLGVELPFTSALTQTTIPLAYIDPATEQISNDETQIWKLTHNGVDTHPVHFHLVNVQVINRVGWDGTVKPPYFGEEGWKETVKMNPLEDIIVAMKAKSPPINTQAGFGLPKSYRLLNPAEPLGSMKGFTQVDPVTGNPTRVVNVMADFDWEYVWHCHILGHEENDFMRPFLFHANEAIPAAPTNASATSNGAGTAVTITWTDVAATEYQYRVERNNGDVAVDTPTGWVLIGTALANAGKAGWVTPGTITDSPTSPGTEYTYRVSAVGASGNGAAKATLTTNGGAPVLPAVPSGVGLSITRSGTSTTLDQVVLTWTSISGNVTGFTIQRATNSSFNNATTFNVGAAVRSLSQFVSRTNNPTYYYRIRANSTIPPGNSGWSSAVNQRAP